MTFARRYSKQINLKGFGAEAQQKLQAATILVVGAGGLGVPALQYLTAMGVGTIGIADGDTVSVSNLNRQVIYYESEAGFSKAIVAATKLSLQNPAIVLKPFNVFINVNNAIEIIQPFDLVIDATDNFSARYLINDACIILGKPFIYGAVQEYEGHVSVFNFDGGPTYRCLYPNFPASGEIPDCNTAGVLGVAPGIIGCQQALEAIKLITGIGKTASGCLRIFDFLNNDQYEIRLKLNPENKNISQLKESYEKPFCSIVPVLKPKELYNWMVSEKELLLIDVREQNEYDHIHFEKSLLLPLTQFRPENISVQNKIPVVTVCQKGGRSVQAANLLHQNNNNLQVYSLQGGIEQWLKEIGRKLIIS